jgi:hypothetical protein
MCIRDRAIRIAFDILGDAEAAMQHLRAVVTALG